MSLKLILIWNNYSFISRGLIIHLCVSNISFCVIWFSKQQSVACMVAQSCRILITRRLSGFGNSWQPLISHGYLCTNRATINYIKEPAGHPQQNATRFKLYAYFSGYTANKGKGFLSSTFDPHTANLVGISVSLGFRQKPSDTALLLAITFTTFKCIASAPVTEGVLVRFVVIVQWWRHKTHYDVTDA